MVIKKKPLTKKQKAVLDAAVMKAIADYGDVFRRLAKS